MNAPEQNFSASALLTLGARYSYAVRGCPIQDSMFSTNPGLYPLETAMLNLKFPKKFQPLKQLLLWLLLTYS